MLCTYMYLYYSSSQADCKGLLQFDGMFNFERRSKSTNTTGVALIVHIHNAYEKAMQVENEKLQLGPLGVIWSYMCIYTCTCRPTCTCTCLYIPCPHRISGRRHSGFQRLFPGSGEKVLYVLTETVALHFSSNSCT